MNPGVPTRTGDRDGADKRRYSAPRLDRRGQVASLTQQAIGGIGTLPPSQIPPDPFFP